MKKPATFSQEFEGPDLATVQDEINDFIDLMRSHGVVAWTCTFWAVLQASVDGQPDRNKWYCSVFEDTTWRRRERWT